MKGARLFLFWFLLVALLMACSKGPEHPLEKEATSIINKKCRVCHSTDRIYAKRRREEEWRAIILRMMGYGAEIDENEAALLLKYLNDKY